MIRKERPRRRIPQIELLRALAMGGIFAFHLWSVVPAVEQSGLIGQLLGRASSYGYLGVVLFNFISGFVLALPYLDGEPREIPPYPKFLRRRFWRISPKYYLTLTLWTGVLLVSAKSPSGTITRDYLAHLAFVHSFFPSMFFSIVPALWWLGLLAQFYLVFPVLLRLFNMFGAAKACLFLCFVCWTGWAILDGVSRSGSAAAMINYMIYYNLPARLPEFALGMWLAQAWNTEVAFGKQTRTAWSNGISPGYLTFAGAALVFAIAGGTVVPFERLPLKHIALVAWCLAAIIAVLLLKASRWMGESKVVTECAAASYSIYLLHQPMLGYSDRLLPQTLPPLAEYFLLLIGVGAASLALATALDRYVP